MQRVVYTLFAVFAAALVIGLALPRRLHVQVERDIDALPATVFAQLNDFRRVNLWAPINGNDPNARVVYAGPDRGEGAAVTWDGAIAGTGAQVITASVPYERVDTVINPGAAGESTSAFRLEPRSGGTHLVWRYETDYGFNVVGRFVALLLEDMVRRENESAAQALQALAEGLPRADFSDIEIEHLSVESMTIAYLPTKSVTDPKSMSDAMGDAYFRILNFIDRHSLREAGAPMSITRSFDGSELHFDAAIPVLGETGDIPRAPGGVRIGTTWAGPVIRVRHTGPYRDLGITHRKIAAYLAALGIDRASAAWEVYVSDPSKVAETELLTTIYYPVAKPAR